MSTTKTTAFALMLMMQAWVLRADSWLTECEQSGFLRTPRYAPTIAFCKKLADASPIVQYAEFGISPQGRALPLVIADAGGCFTPEAVRASGKLVLMVMACIHPGEPEGKDAGLMLIRDLAIHGLHPGLLDHVTLLFIPIFNVDGHERFGPYNRINQNGPEEMGWRTTAQNLNLNRDFMKADAPEMQAWLRLFHQWKPDFFIDTHTTNGADYQYVLTYSLETGKNTDPETGSWLAREFVPAMEKHMNGNGFPVFPYVSFRRWHDPRSGLYTQPAPAMLSHGYLAACNRPGLLVETHMLKPYKPRVESTREIIRFVMQHMNGNKAQYQELNRRADSYTSSVAFRNEPFPMQFALSKTDSTMVDFAGIRYHIEKSDLTGGDWFIYDGEPLTMRLPMFSQYEVTNEIRLPEYYIIPPEWEEVIKRIKLHGIETQALKTAMEMEVETWQFSDPRWSRTTYEGRHSLTVDARPLTEKREFQAGSLLISTRQPMARVIARLLEPNSSDSFLYWGFFNAIFEQKEYSETYVMEKMAREMIARDPTLDNEFRAWKEQNPQYANDSWSQLNWFYRRTPWFDQKLNRYPVCKISGEQAYRLSNP
jgi:hypothetical protein